MHKSPVALVVDDSPDFRLLLSSLFKHMGLDVVTARDGETGLALAAEHRPDIVCLDLMLPVLCGLEVCERLKQSPETADLPVLIVSARRYPQDRADAHKVGADGYVTKPVDRNEFVTQVRSILWRRHLAKGA